MYKATSVSGRVECASELKAQECCQFISVHTACDCICSKVLQF